MNPEFWHGRRVLVTGHTGFKGAWLSLWLSRLGARVHGLALAPETEPNLYELAGMDERVRSTIGDIRDAAVVASVLASVRPEIVIHMAAQSLVRRGYAQPAATFTTNVIGTAHVLDEARRSDSTIAVLVITSDKCYENLGIKRAYREDDRLGGRDPYAASKAAAEIITHAFRESFAAGGGPAIASARAGNVIGGGDWAEDRLIPDAVRAWSRGDSVNIRSPDATRPWQHVLDPLVGYMTLCERLADHGAEVSCGWNFGPDDADFHTVRWIIERASLEWGSSATWQAAAGPTGPPEAADLRLDASKARRDLGWRSALTASEALSWTIEWYKEFCVDAGRARQICEAQIDRYEDLDRRA